MRTFWDVSRRAEPEIPGTWNRKLRGHLPWMWEDTTPWHRLLSCCLPWSFATFLVVELNTPVSEQSCVLFSTGLHSLGNLTKKNDFKYFQVQSHSSLLNAGWASYTLRCLWGLLKLTDLNFYSAPGLYLLHEHMITPWWIQWGNVQVKAWTTPAISPNHCGRKIWFLVLVTPGPITHHFTVTGAEGVEFSGKTSWTLFLGHCLMMIYDL